MNATKRARAGLVLGGMAGAVLLRAITAQALLAKARGDVKKLNTGAHEALLASYAKDAVLRFTDGDHRWAGDHIGRPAIDRFLRNFTGAGLQAELKDLLIAGPPWSLRTIWRLDDWAEAPDGTRIYENRVCMVIRTRWGKIVEHEDFYEDTRRIPDFEQKLRELGNQPITA
jgi:ketosteroid isomerase-like protein